MAVARPALVTALLLFGGASVSLAQPASDPLEQRLESLEGAVRAQDKQVADLSALLRAVLPPSPIEEIAPVELIVAGSASAGSASAKVVLIEFSDFECPFCGRHAAAAYGELQRHFVDTGKIRYVFRHLPLESFIPRHSRPPKPPNARGIRASSGRCTIDCSRINGR